MFGADRSDDCRIIRRDWSASAQGRLHQSRSAGTRASRPTCRTSGARPRSSRTEAAYSAARSALYDSGIDAAKNSASFCPQNVRICNRQIVTSDCKVKIVLECEADRIFKRKVKLAIANELCQQRRIAKLRLGYLARQVGAERIARFWHVE